MSEYRYSKIDNIQVKNFRNIVDTQINFNESPIVCLVGDNESGKTSFNMAVSVLAGHKNPREQKSYIREGTNGFGVLMKLEDGHEIVRIKSDTMNGYLVKDGDEVVYQTSKLGEGLPVQVSDLMGIIEEEETGEFLQFRTYEDNVLFAYTTPSTNYKMVYGALKVEQLTKAISLGNKEVNEYKEEKNRLEIASGTIMGQIKSINIIDTSNLEKVISRVKMMLRQSEELNRLRKAYEERKVMESSIPDISSLHEIEGMDRLEKLDRLRRLLASSRENIVDVSGLEEIKDMPKLEKLDRLRKLKEESLIEIASTEGLEEIGSGQLKNLTTIQRLMEQRDKLLQSKKELESYENKQEALDKEQESLLEELRANGIKIITCPRCGETIPFDESEVIG